MRNYFFILALLFITITGCKKYEDGPLVSLRSPETRITGNWAIEGYYIDGENAEIIEVFEQVVCNGNQERVLRRADKLLKWDLILEESGKMHMEQRFEIKETSNYCEPSYRKRESHRAYTGSWEFINDKTELKLSFDANDRTEVYTIRELRKKSLFVVGDIPASFGEVNRVGLSFRKE
ncbi:hypothetical protein RCC89_03260 [Cytophagaceae bacterium ABcell3]|nr:hypothetical protein RCC89_03260 [Cytophagaceae bacterium ABcell3]